MAHAQHAAAAQPNPEVAALVARARTAQAIANGYDQERVDELVAAAGWAIIEPARNRALAELAVLDTGIGNVDDKIRKNYRKTLGLLRDLHGAKSVGVIMEDAANGITEIARPVGVVCAVTPSTNPAATPANKIINALKGRNAVIVAPSPAVAAVARAPAGQLFARPAAAPRPLTTQSVFRPASTSYNFSKRLAETLAVADAVGAH